MKFKKFFFVFLSVLFLDIIFSFFAYQELPILNLVNMILFDFLVSTFIVIFTSIFSVKANKILLYVIYFILWFWYSLYYVFYKVFITPFSISLFRQSDQVLKFGKSIFISIIQNSFAIVLFFIPTLLLIIFRKNLNHDKLKLKKIFIWILIFLISIGCYVVNIFIQGKGKNKPYNLFYETNNVSLNIRKLGVLSATYLDVKRAIFGFNEKIDIVNQTEEEEESQEEIIINYEYNNLDINFDNGNSSQINDFLKNELGTKQNEYTGMFKGKNLVYIVAESFSEIAVSEELTPTLYKLVHEGFDFKNFYTSNNLSTIGGEFQALTGLYADNAILSSWRSGGNYYPYGLATVFKDQGYKTFAYHNNSAYFQDRNVYLKSQGFDNFMGCYNGLEKRITCGTWPQSDIEMIDATTSDYIDSEEPFLVYYMTVSGHFYYTFSENAIAKKYKSQVNTLDYPEDVRGYLATQIELDKALELLLNKLEEKGKLDDTVIVLLADHYPYKLSIDRINLLSDYERDTLIEANSNNLIIYNPSINGTVIEKVGMSIDVLPTVLNLFGIDYDSRIIMGKDILSTTEGIAIFKDKSWVTNKGTYFAAKNTFNPTTDDIPEGYIDMINNIVNNRVAISRMIVQNNYYKYLFK